MTAAPGLRELVELARKMTSPAQDGPNVFGSADWWRSNGQDLARGILSLFSTLDRPCNLDDESIAGLVYIDAHPPVTKIQIERGELAADEATYAACVIAELARKARGE